MQSPGQGQGISTLSEGLTLEFTFYFTPSHVAGLEVDSITAMFTNLRYNLLTGNRPEGFKHELC